MMPGAQQASTSPAMPSPVRIPSPDDPDLLEARRRRMQQEFSRREGVAAATLAPDAGGPAYDRTTLG